MSEQEPVIEETTPHTVESPVFDRPQPIGSGYSQSTTYQVTNNLMFSPSTTLDELQVISRMPADMQEKAMALAKKEQQFRHAFIDEDARREHSLRQEAAAHEHELEMRRLNITAMSEVGGKACGCLVAVLFLAAIVFMAYSGLYWQIGAALAGFFTLLLGVGKAFLWLMGQNRASK